MPILCDIPTFRTRMLEFPRCLLQKIVKGPGLVLITHTFWWTIITSSLSLFPGTNSLKPHDKLWPHPDETRSFSGGAPTAAVPSSPPCRNIGCSTPPPSEFLTWTPSIPVSQNSSQKLRPPLLAHCFPRDYLSKVQSQCFVLKDNCNSCSPILILFFLSSRNDST